MAKISLTFSNHGKGFGKLSNFYSISGGRAESFS